MTLNGPARHRVDLIPVGVLPANIEAIKQAVEIGTEAECDADVSKMQKTEQGGPHHYCSPVPAQTAKLPILRTRAISTTPQEICAAALSENCLPWIFSSVAWRDKGGLILTKYLHNPYFCIKCDQAVVFTVLNANSLRSLKSVHGLNRQAPRCRLAK